MTLSIQDLASTEITNFQSVLVSVKVEKKAVKHTKKQVSILEFFMIRGLLIFFLLVIFSGCGPLKLREQRDVSLPNELAVGDYVTIVTTDNEQMSFTILEKTESSFRGEFKGEDIELPFDQIKSITVEKPTMEGQLMGPVLVAGGVVGAFAGVIAVAAFIALLAML